MGLEEERSAHGPAKLSRASRDDKGGQTRTLPPSPAQVDKVTAAVPRVWCTATGCLAMFGSWCEEIRSKAVPCGLGRFAFGVDDQSARFGMSQQLPLVVVPIVVSILHLSFASSLYLIGTIP